MTLTPTAPANRTELAAQIRIANARAKRAPAVVGKPNARPTDWDAAHITLDLLLVRWEWAGA